MDLYHSIHGHDVSSFDLPSTHRLPTVSAADAFEELNEDASRFISTGLEPLDKVLAGDLPQSSPSAELAGGIQKSQVTEVWGPPGAGKSILSAQLATNVLMQGGGVVWVDAFHPMCYNRLAALTQGITDGDQQHPLHKSPFAHFTCATLNHFIALLCRPAPACVPTGTTLVVIDSLSALINHAFPRLQDAKVGGFKGGNKAPTPAARRLQLLQYITGALQKLAAARNVAVVILTQCATRMQAERGATLIPAISAGVWEQAISTRLVLFRDWAWDSGKPTEVHCAGVQKLNGRANVELTDVVAFTVNAVSSASTLSPLLPANEEEKTGLAVAQYDNSQHYLSLPSTSARKRKFGDTLFEVPDSDDDEYGWQQDDDGSMPKMPPQWQGSEDILLGEQQNDGDETELSESEGEGEGAPDEDNEALDAR